MSLITYNDADGKPGIVHPGPYIIVLCGLPGSGKSTFREMFRSDGVHLSTDDLVEEVAKWEGTTYDQVWEREIKRVTQVVQENFRNALKHGDSIVWDQTNLTVKKRKAILSQVPEKYYKVAIFIQVHEDIRQQRLVNRPGKVIPPHVDKSMLDSLTVPTKDEGFDEVLVLTMGTPHTGREKTELMN